jgi:hypothetical protein
MLTVLRDPASARAHAPFFLDPREEDAISPSLQRRHDTASSAARRIFFARRTSGALSLATSFAITIASALAVAPDAQAAEPSDADLMETPLTQVTTPPPLNTPYLQYGVSFTAEFVANAGRMCPDIADCILGSGGGVAARIGRRSAGPWYFGAAYELSKQDPNRLYRLAILQQLRGEARYYIGTGKDTQPYGSFGAGVAGYGNEWGVDTFGPNVFVAIGLETQLSRRTVVGIALAYRAMYMTKFTDPITGEARLSGLAQLIGIDVSLEGRDPL